MKTLLTPIATTVLLAFNFLFPISLFAQPGSLDTAFGTNGIVITSVGSNADKIHSLVIQPDGKIIAVGTNIVTGVDNDIALVRYNTDGSLDTDFGTGGKVTTAIGNGDDQGNAVLLQPDGKIVVCGISDGDTTGSVIYDAAVVRYNVNGSLDPNFGVGGIVTTHVGAPGFQGNANAMVFQTDGKIIISGTSNGGLNPNDFFIIRYTTNGTIDTSYGTNGIVITNIGTSDDTIYGMAIQNDGEIILGGTTTVPGDQPNFALARYDTDGNLESTFGSGGIVSTDFGNNYSENGRSVVIQSDGKIVLAGFIYGTSTDYAMARYNTNGSLDTGFGINGIVTTPIGTLQDYGSMATLQPDDKILVAGYSSIFLYDFSLVRYNANGSLDPTFGTNGKVATDCDNNSNDFAYALAFQNDGKIVLGGSSWNDFAIARYNGDDGLGTVSNNILTPTLKVINPGTNIFTIQSSAIINGEMLVYNMLGEKIAQSTIRNSNNTTVDLSAVAKGVYFIKVHDQVNIYTKKIIIQ